MLENNKIIHWNDLYVTIKVNEINRDMNNIPNLIKFEIYPQIFDVSSGVFHEHEIKYNKSNTELVDTINNANPYFIVYISSVNNNLKTLEDKMDDNWENVGMMYNFIPLNDVKFVLQRCCEIFDYSQIEKHSYNMLILYNKNYTFNIK
jgi:hypothetical protein